MHKIFRSLRIIYLFHDAGKFSYGFIQNLASFNALILYLPSFKNELSAFK